MLRWHIKFVWSCSAHFGLAMSHQNTSHSSAKLKQKKQGTRRSDMPPKCTKKVRLAVNMRIHINKGVHYNCFIEHKDDNNKNNQVYFSHFA